MAGQKQHVDLYRKRLLRARLLKRALPGAVYVPFCGDGDLAVSHYQDRPIFAADLDSQRVELARSRLPGATVLVADCDGWPFPGCQEMFAVADLDAYANPYKALVAFWANARKADKLVVFGTDGLRQRIGRGGVLKTLPSGAETKAPLAECRRQYNFWWQRYVLPFIRQTVAPYKVHSHLGYLRRSMLYWGVILEA